MAANQNKILSGGKADGLVKRITTARTSLATIASPSDAADLRLIFTAGTNHGFLDEIGYNVVGTGTQLASLVYVWRTDSSGANAEVVYTFTVAAAGSAMSNTIKGQTERWYPLFENMAAGEKIFMSVSVISASCEFIVWGRGGQFESQ